MFKIFYRKEDGNVMYVTHQGDQSIEIPGCGVLLTTTHAIPNEDAVIDNGQTVCKKASFMYATSGLAGPYEITVGLRTHRNELLNASDWTQVSDNQLSEEERELWKQYRQELRDLKFNPHTVFPEEPSLLAKHQSEYIPERYLQAV